MFIVLVLIFSSISGIVADSSEDIHEIDPVSEVYFSRKIPDKMYPGSKIRYISSSEFIIESGGVVNDTFKDFASIPSDKKEDVIYENYPDPITGLVITYASDGLIDEFIFPSNVQNPLLVEKDTPRSAFSAKNLVEFEPFAIIGGIFCDYSAEVARWGTYPNVLYNCTELNNSSVYSDVNEATPFGPVYRNYRIGTGRATTFSDTIGQANIKLQKGDAATKLAYDNVSVGTVLRVTTKNINGVNAQRALNKRDAGGMPNAVLDIWKTGVEYWGYTWSSTFSMPYSVSYYYPN